MTKAQEKAKTILIILDRVDDPEIKNDLVRLFTIPYLEHTKEKPAGEGEEIIEKILEFLRAVADGKIAIDDKEDFGSGIPPLEELVGNFEEARKQGSIGGIEEAQVRKALIKAVIAQKKEEQIIRLLKEAGISQTAEAKKDILGVLGDDGQTADIPEKIKQAAQRYGIPQDKAEALVGAMVSLFPREGDFLETPRYARIPVMGKTGGTPAVPEQETAGEERKALLIRISYKRPSILNLVLQELSKIPGELPGAAFETQGEMLPVLVNHGIGPEKLRLAVENFRLQNPGLAENHPVILSLKETLEALADYSRRYPGVDGVIKNYQNEIGVDLSLVNEAVKDLPSTNSRVFLRAVVRPGRDGVLRLFAVPPSKKEVRVQTPSVPGVLKQTVVPKNVLSRFLVSFKKLLALPTSLLAGLRGYFGGAFIISALFLPLPLPVRIVMAGGGFWLGWKQIKGFFGNFVPQILSGLKRVELLKLFSKTLGDILYTIFTKPTLGWLRNALAVGFGAGALFLPVSIPLKILFLGVGGMFGTVQLGAGGSSFLLRGMGAVGRAGVRLSYALTTLPGIPLALILGAILVGVLVPGFLAYQSAQTQALFLPQAGGPDQTANIQSPYLSIEKKIDSSILKNEELPKTVNVTITITAKDKPVTLISVKEEFSVSGSSGSINSQTLNLSKNNLAPGESIELKISINLDSGFKNSAVTAITRVEADVELEKGKTRTSAVSASAIIVGLPPTFCFAFEGGWPESDKSLVVGAISHISKAQVFVSKLCSKGSVRILRYFTDPGWSGEVPRDNTINLYNRAFTSSAQILYVLSHEIGHVYGRTYLGDLSRFRIDGKPIEEGYFPTYPEILGSQLSLDVRISEDFAETVAIYTIWRVVPYLGQYYLPDLIMQKPSHYSFAKTYIFGGFEF